MSDSIPSTPLELERNVLLSIFKTCDKKLRKLLYQILEVGDESVKVVMIFYAFVWWCGTDHEQYATQIKLVNRNPEFHRLMRDEMIPRYYDWASTLSQRYLQMKEFKATIGSKLRGSMSPLGMTPSEATRAHQVDLKRQREYWQAPPPYGYIRIHFFSSFEKGRYRPGEDFVAPDARLDVQLYEYWGADLREVKEQLGIESIAVITDVAPFRTIFEPAFQDRLSLLAAVDLSKNFTRPIRVFEPYVSRPTEVKRTIYESTQNVLSKSANLMQAALGFQPRDPEYATVFHGESFVATCNSISHASRAFQHWTMDGASLLIQLLSCILLIPLVLGSYVPLAATYTVKRAMGVSAHGVRSGIKSAVGGVTYAQTIPKEGWIALLGICWFVAAEYHSLEV